MRNWANASDGTHRRSYHVIFQLFQKAITNGLLNIRIRVTVEVKSISVWFAWDCRATYVPGSASFFAWSTILTSAWFSNRTTSPPLVYHRVSHMTIHSVIADGLCTFTSSMNLDRCGTRSESQNLMPWNSSPWTPASSETAESTISGAMMFEWLVMSCGEMKRCDQSWYDRRRKKSGFNSMSHGGFKWATWTRREARWEQTGIVPFLA